MDSGYKALQSGKYFMNAELQQSPADPTAPASEIGLSSLIATLQITSQQKETLKGAAAPSSLMMVLIVPIDPL